MNEYTIGMRITGRFTATVMADAPEQARELALQAFDSADFGPLSDIESDIV